MRGAIPVMVLVWVLGAGGASAQPRNDACAEAVLLTNLQGWCSPEGAYHNRDAAGSPVKGDCFPSMFGSNPDVWFRFTAIGNTLHISVKGRMAEGPKGSLERPQIALYEGGCGGRQVSCNSDNLGYGIVESFATDLVIGATYYLQVSGRNGSEGSFQLCINNFNAVPSPSSDCSSAVVLCDKEGFTVPSLTGAGRNRHELNGICLQEENSSSWYKWTCDQPGTLTFTLTPVNPSDDIDFAVFLLPDGLDGCPEKIPLRCMASGENLNAPPSSWAACTGATGLRDGALDFEESAGCAFGDDNFLAPLVMEAGKSYALVVQNFSRTGSGFSIEFGGTGTFVSPKAHFYLSKRTIEVGQPLGLRDASTFPGGIVGWDWNFGEGASPQKSSRQGPHKVVYRSPGKKSIRLTVATANGCQVTVVRTVTVVEPPPKPVVVVEKEPPPPPPSPKPTPPDTLPTLVNPRTPTSTPELKPAPEPPSPGPTAPEPKPEPVPVYDVERVVILYYQSDSFHLVEEHYPFLEEVLELLRRDPALRVLVEGHTNSIPQQDYCLRLSADRANEVIDYLRRHGIPADRIDDRLFGKLKPKASNKSLRGRKKNQRVEIKLLRKVE